MEVIKTMNSENQKTNLLSLVEEMGEARVKKYIKAYLELKQDRNLFLETFSKYIESRIPDKNGFKPISISSFKKFILELNQH